MKGQSMPEEIGMTLVFLVVVMVLAIMLVFVNLIIKYPILRGDFTSSNAQISYSIDFVSIANKPFMLAEVLSHVKPDGRQLLEQSIEAVTVNSLDNASATNLPGNLKSFVDSYQMSYYISINNNNKPIAVIESTDSKCGDNLEGWCVSDTYLLFGNTCDVGRVEINQGKNGCWYWQRCCREDKVEYAKSGKYAVVSCGNGVGVCSEGVRPHWYSLPNIGPLTFYKPVCAQNRIKLDTPECNKPGVNSGNTPVCCAPQTEQNEIITGVSTKATVPLLYKNLVYGTLEVTSK